MPTTPTPKPRGAQSGPGTFPFFCKLVAFSELTVS